MSAPVRTIVGMSGGVDSSVAALHLRDAGEPIAGLFMQNWADDGSGDCRAEDDRRDAVAVSGRLGIPIHFRDFSGEYWAGVFEHFLAEYAAGRTPNPDVLCNREIKFKHFLDAARELGAEFIATGHYARVEDAAGRHLLLRAVDRSKDQSYFLHQLGQAQLAATRFPLGGLLKRDVRQMALDAGLPTAAKKDSTGICFIGERDFREFLGRYLPAREGEMRTPDGQVIGQSPGRVLFHPGPARGPQHRRRTRFRGGAVVRGRQGCRRQRAATSTRAPTAPGCCRRRSGRSRRTGSPARRPPPRFACTAQTRYRQADEACEVNVRR